MTSILFLGMVVLAVLLTDTRKRLAALERQLRDQMPVAGIEARRSSPIADRSEGVSDKTPSTRPEPAPDGPLTGQESEPVPKPAAMQPARAKFALPRALSARISTAEVPTEPRSATATDAGPAQTVKAPGRSRAFLSFEDLFGRKLPIWAGGITLVVAAVLLVRYSIDAGLLSPTVRVILGLLFGGVLVGGAECARRWAHKVQDVRVSQSLSGAGLGSFYAATLAAANLYGLIGPGAAFAGLAVITAFAMVLALRFGVPSAVLGLIGGLVTPAVIESATPNVPLLAGYIAVVVGGVTLLSRHQRWTWLGISALVGGAGWSLFMILMSGLGQFSMLAVGLLVLLMGIGLPVLAAEGRHTAMVRGAGAIVAAGQLALLVATGGFAPLSWGLYGLLSIAFVWLTGRAPTLRRSLAVPMLAALLLVGFWPSPDVGLFSAVIAGILFIYGGAAIWRLWRPGGSPFEAGLIAAIALGCTALCLWHFHIGAPGQDMRFALLAIGFSLFPAVAAALGWQKEQRREDIRFALLASTTGLLLVAASALGLPLWSLPIAIVIIAAALLAIAIKGQDTRLSLGALVFFAGGVATLLATAASNGELVRFVMDEPHGQVGQAILRWGTALLVAAFFAWRHVGTRYGASLQGVTVVLGYGLAAQIIPAPWLAITAAAALLVLTEVMKRKAALVLLPALGAVAALAVLWALAPFAQWFVPALGSLFGEPLLASHLPSPGSTIRRLLVPALAGGWALWHLRQALPRRAWMLGMGQIGALVLIGVHILYKQLFRIETMDGFTQLGLAERTVWQAGLIAGGVVLWRVFGQRIAALAFIGLGLAHNLVYSLLLHNPLWSEQAVGGLPLVNLLLPACGIAFAAPLLIARIVPEHALRLRRPTHMLHMAVILLFAFVSLRQLFVGSLLVGSPVGPAENISASVLAIALAVGFLVWGIRQGLGDWRIASLLLMLLAVGKVFLFDASGLDGLLRIASFVALGLSLIGIGWLYSRYLRPGDVSSLIDDVPGRYPAAP